MNALKKAMGLYTLVLSLHSGNFQAIELDDTNNAVI